MGDETKDNIDLAYEKDREQRRLKLIKNIKIDFSKVRIPKERFLKLMNNPEYCQDVGSKFPKDLHIKDVDFQKEFLKVFSKIQRDTVDAGLNVTEKGLTFSPKNTYTYPVNFITEYYDIHTIRGEKTEMWITIDGIERPNAVSYIQEMCRLIYGNHYTKMIAQQVIDRIAVDTQIDHKTYFESADSRYIAVGNGIFDTYAHSIIPTPKGVRFFSKIAVDYNDKAECPNFLEHITQVIDDKTDVRAIQEFFGYGLVRHHKIEKAFVWLGDGRNGKGKTAEVLVKMLGRENVVNEPMSSIEVYPFALGNLFGKHLNCIAEFEQEQIKSTAKFKNLTGNDEVTAPRKHLSALTFKSYAKWLILANELPQVKDLTIAFFDRISIIKFPYTFLSKPDYDLLTVEQIGTGKYKIADPHKVDKLITKEELEGVLLWSLEGFYRLMENKGFTTSKSDQDVMRIWKQSSNNFSTFAEEYIENDWDEWISKKELRYIYTIYCKRQELKPVKDRTITQFMQVDLGVQVQQKFNAETDYNKLYVWDGIKFNKDIEELLEWGKKNGYGTPVSGNVPSTPKFKNAVFVEPRGK